MRRFETTPQKQFLGMLILFVFIPLFVLLYTLLVFNWRPSTSTMVVAIAIALLFYYFYRRYQKQAAEAGQAGVQEETGEEQQNVPEEMQGEQSEQAVSGEQEEPAGTAKK